MKKRYIKTKPLEPIEKKERKTAEQMDKEARIYAMAQKLRVKIGG